MEKGGRGPIVRVMAITLIAGVLVSALAAYFKHRSNDNYVRWTINSAADNFTRSLEARMHVYQYGLRGIRGVVLAAGEGEISRDKFQHYSLTRDIENEFPGALGFGFIRRVPASAEAVFLQRARADGAPDFSIRQITPHSGDRYVIQYIEPVERNRAAIGLDIASESNRREGAMSALRTGKPTLTAPVTLVQTPNQAPAGYLLLLPIYRSAVPPANEGDREASLIGWSYTALQVDQVLTGLRFLEELHRLTLWDITSPEHKQLIYASEDHGTPIVYTHRLERELFGRRWLIEFSMHPAFITMLHLTSSTFVLTTGCIVSLLLSALSGIASVYRRQKRQTETRVLELNANLERQVTQRTQELAQANQLLTGVLESASEVSVIATDRDGIITLFNEGSERMLGYQSAEVIGKMTPAPLHVPEEVASRGAELSTEYNAPIEGFRVFVHKPALQGSETREWTYVRKDGSHLPVSLTVTVTRDETGTVTGYLGIASDITSQLELESTLREAKDQADAASAAKSAFLANMSHEIRTPMNAVLGMLQLVQKTGLDARQRDYIDKANSAARSLLDLLNDILDYSKIEADKLELELHSFELETLMQDLAIVLSGSQTKADVEIVFDMAPTLPSVLIGDSLRLKQVLINLAGNALKFTAHGYVEVSITELSRSHDRIELRITVTDTGIGINPEQQARIFEGFSQAEASTTRRFGGTGLGLAISQRLVALMGGMLQLESAPDRGSRFWFDIELHIAPQSVPLISTYPLTNTVIRALVVDDNPLTAEVLVRTMADLGWQAEHVDDGHQAVQHVAAAAQRNEPYDVVFMDWRLPDLDGVSAAQQICDNAADTGRSPAIIMTTAYGREVLAETQHDPNPPFVDFLTKPVTPMQLVTAMQRAMGNAAAMMSPAPTPTHLPQLHGLRLLVVEDNALNRQIAASLLTSEGAQVQLAEGGLDGVAQVLSAQHTFDVVIMDIQMPDIDGLEATRRIRSDPRFRELPILAMTANASPADREQCLAAGMNEHIGKPIDLDELVLTLMALRHGLPDGAQSSAAVVQQDLTDTEALASILRRFGGNKALFRTMLAQFKVEAAGLLDELARQSAQANWAGVAATLHTLKGNTGTLGTTALSRRLGELQRAFKAADSATKTGLLSASVIADLKQQLAAGIAQLEVASGPADKRIDHAQVEPLTAELWRSRLTDILRLLESSDMQAIEQVEALAVITPRDQQVQFGQLFTQVQGLDFIAAAASIRTLIKGE